MRWGIWPPEWVKLLGQGGLNWVPTVYRFLSGTTTYTRWWEILDVWNIAMFVPLGIFLTVLWKKLASWRGLAAGAGVSLGIELFQPLVGRSFDVDDLIHNVLGVAAGLLIGLLLCRVASGLAGKIRGEANTAGG